MAIEEIARAKVNLYLHIKGKRDDGYHLLDSFAVFPEVYDRITVEPGKRLTLNIKGPFADQLNKEGPVSENLVIQAARKLQERLGEKPGAKITLEKNLPIASGIGGGSADAAATLRALMRLWDTKPNVWRVSRLSKRVGADVPACMVSRPILMSGIGEELSVPPKLPRMFMLLVNPGKKVSTPKVFEGVNLRSVKVKKRPKVPAKFKGWDHFEKFLGEASNDLEASAKKIAPVIGDVLKELKKTQAPLLTRMSGSGATCFSLYRTENELNAARERIVGRQPKWWVAGSEL